MSTPTTPLTATMRGLASLSLGIFLLAGCGGGGDGGGGASEGSSDIPETVTNPPAGSPPAADPGYTVDQFLSIGKVDQEDRGLYVPNRPYIPTHTIYAAIDPTNPAGSRQTPTVSAGLGGSRVVPALRYDPVTRSVTVEGSSKFFYLQGGRLYQLGLRKTDSAAARIVSSQTGICDIGNVFPSSWSAKDGWVEVTTPATPGGPCYSFTSEVSLTTKYIRFNAAAADPAVQLPGGKLVMGPLPTVNQDGPWFFTVGSLPSYSGVLDPFPFDADLRSTEGRTQPLPELFGHPAEAWVPPTTQLGDLLEQVVWGYPDDSRMSGASETYVIEQGGLVKLVGGVRQPFATFDTTRGEMLSIKAVTPTHVLVQQSKFGNAFAQASILWALPKDGGARVQLSEEAPNPLPTYWLLSFIGYDNLHAYYGMKVDGPMGAFNNVATITYRVRLQDGQRTALSDNAPKFAQPLFDRQRSLVVPPLRGLAWVDFDGSLTAGILKVYDTSTSQTRTLGVIPSVGLYTWQWSILGSHDDKAFYWDTPLVLAGTKFTTVPPATTSSRETRFYTARPSVSNSLTQMAQLP